MSGNAHQKKVMDKAIERALQKRENPAPTPASNKPSESPPRVLGQSSVEAYVFFIIAGVYVVMSAFGIPVNFWVGLGMSLAMAAAATHLLWSSIWTHNWNWLAKAAGTVIVGFAFLLVVNQGYVHTHKQQNPNAETLSAIQNLAGLITSLPKPNDAPEIHQNTQIFEVDPKFPDLQLAEPIDNGTSTSVDVKITNLGNAIARDVASSAGLFIGARGVDIEDEIFKYLYKREKDSPKLMTYGDISPGEHITNPIAGPVRRPNGDPVSDIDRALLYQKTAVLYMALLAVYEDSHGRVYHREVCYYTEAGMTVNKRCRHHNGDGQ